MNPDYIIEEEIRDPFSAGSDINTPMTILGLINGTIGSALLILPVISISAGYVTSIWVTTSVGLATYYTADLIVLHLGKGRSIKESILAHF